jgi:hypothetical protein
MQESGFPCPEAFTPFLENKIYQYIPLKAAKKLCKYSILHILAKSFIYRKNKVYSLSHSSVCSPHHSQLSQQQLLPPFPHDLDI